MELYTSERGYEFMVKVIYLFLIEMKTSWRYKIEVITSLLWLFSMCIPAIGIILFGNINSNILPFESKVTYLLFLLVSSGYWGFIENFWDTIFELRKKMREGILEQTLLMPLKNYQLLLGWALKGMLTTAVQIFPILIFVIVYYAYSLDLYSILLVLMIFIVSIIANYGLCLILVGIAFIWKEADQVISIVANIAPFVCGLYFPISILPAVFLPLGLLFPFTWALDLMRMIIFQTNTLLDPSIEVIIFLIISVIYVFLGNKIYSYLVVKAKKEGLSKF